MVKPCTRHDTVCPGTRIQCGRRRFLGASGSHQWLSGIWRMSPAGFAASFLLQNLGSSLAAREYRNAALGARRQPAGAQEVLEAPRRNYRIAFLRQLPKCDEIALALPYGIGRSAVVDDASVSVRTRINHEGLRENVAGSGPGEVDRSDRARGRVPRRGSRQRGDGAALTARARRAASSPAMEPDTVDAGA